MFFRLEDLQNQSISDREQIERQNQQLSEYEADINILRTRVESLESDREKDKKQSIRDREQIERQNQQLSEHEAEINILRKRVESLENDHEKDKKEIARLQDALNRPRIVSDGLVGSIEFLRIIINVIITGKQAQEI